MGFRDNLKGKLSKIGNSIKNSEVVAKLKPEQEDEMINKIARAVSRFGMETPALLLFETMKPISFLVSNLTILPLAPFLELFGAHGYRYVSFFEKPANLERLVKKLEENRLT